MYSILSPNIFDLCFDLLAASKSLRPYCLLSAYSCSQSWARFARQPVLCQYAFRVCALDSGIALFFSVILRVSRDSPVPFLCPRSLRQAQPASIFRVGYFQSWVFLGLVEPVETSTCRTRTCRTSETLNFSSPSVILRVSRDSPVLLLRPRYGLQRPRKAFIILHGS